MSSSDMSEEDEEPQSWIEWFCQLRGHEFFCEIDPSYIADGFNLYGLRTQVKHMKECLELILGSADHSGSDQNDFEREHLFYLAKRLYGLIHARFILTAQGQRFMLHKYEFGDFGTCPRVLCGLANVLPIGMHTSPGRSTVKLFCPQCQDVYEPPRKMHRDLDGAYFGPTFPHLLLMVKPEAFPPKPFRVYIPRIYGFRVHSSGRNYPLLDRAKTPAATRAHAWNEEMKARSRGSKRRAKLRQLASAAPTTNAGGEEDVAGAGAADASMPGPADGVAPPEEPPTADKATLGPVAAAAAAASADVGGDADPRLATGGT